MMILALVSGPKVRAEEAFLFYDCSGSARDYRETVALLNRQPAFFSLEGGTEAAQPTAVLYQYRGICPDMTDWAPLCVVEGPRQHVTLVFASPTEARQAVDALSALENTVYAELDGDVCAVSAAEAVSAAVSEEPLFYSKGADKMGFAPYLALARKYAARSVTVAVIDSGVFQHSLILPKMQLWGYDYVDADDDPTNDLFGHGTHVAGIIADCTAGAPVNIYPVRVLDENGRGKMSNLINAISEAADAGARYINISMTSDTESEALHAAIHDAVASGAEIIVAAGNNAVNTAAICPAHMTDAGVTVVSSAVGEINDWTRASYANYGDSVDYYAFGSNIVSCSRSGGYVSSSGTSMAAPHITAALALTELLHPGAAPNTRLQWVSETGIPDLRGLSPLSMGFRARQILLEDTLRVPQWALPATCCEPITWSSSDESVVAVADGCLVPRAEGRAAVTAACFGFDPVTVDVTVVSPGPAVTLPSGLTTIGSGAFAGSGIRRVILPEGVLRLESLAFSDCPGLSAIRLPLSLRELAPDAFLGSESALLLLPAEHPLLETIAESDVQYIVH